MLKKNESGTPGSWIILFFFFSGMSGLIYEILWVRQLSMFVGGSAFSVSIVLTVFMCGLAAGSAIVSRVIDRIQNNGQLISLYGLLELATGIYAFIFPFLMTLLKPLYAVLYGSLYMHFFIYNIASGFLSILVLIIPTTLMGATLPVLARFYIRSVKNTGSGMGFLYGMNTIGGALGSLLCGFILIRYLGIRGTLMVAVLLNLSIGIFCLFHARKHGSMKIVMLPDRISGGSFSDIAKNHAGILMILFVSGFSAMSYEVIWTKLLALLAGPTTYSFTLVLFTFITGLALGSLLFGWLSDRVKNPFLLLIATQLVAAVSAMLVSQVMGNTQFYFAKLFYHFRDSFMTAEFFKGLTLFFMMLVPSLCLGAVFPVSVKLAVKNDHIVGSSVGILYAWNTVGALLGSFISGFVLIPLTGKSISLSLTIVLQFLTACAVVMLSREIPRKKNWMFIPAGMAFVILSFFMPRWNQAAYVQGRYQRFSLFTPVLENTSFVKALFPGENLFRTSEKPRVLHVDDGIGGFMAVCELTNHLGVTSRYMSVSGKIEASTQDDKSTMFMLAHLPMLLHPDAKDVLVIGMGTGITAGQILCYPVKGLDILEISPEVVMGAEYFNEWNNNVLNNPSSHIIVQDARTHITLTDRTYDVITAEPSNIWMSGLSNLFTLEYFEKIKGHLNPHGIFVQWFHAYQSDWTVFSSIGRTFVKIFNNAMLFRPSLSGGDFLLVGFRDENDRIDPETLEKNIRYLENHSEMRMKDPYVLYPLIVAENLKNLFGEGFLHTDNDPRLEYLAPYHLYSEGSTFDDIIKKGSRVRPSTLKILERFNQPENKIIFAEFIVSLNNPPFNMMSYSELGEREAEKLAGIEKEFCGNNMYPYPLIQEPRSLDNCVSAHEQKLTAQLAEMESKKTDPEQAGWMHFELAKVTSFKRDYGQAMRHLEMAQSALPGEFNVMIYQAYVYQDMNDHSNAIRTFKRLHEMYPNTHELLIDLSECYMRINDLMTAKKYIEEALQFPSLERKASAPALIIYMNLREWDKALPLAREMVDNDPGHSLPVLRSTATLLARDGQYQNALVFINRGLQLFPDDPVLVRLKNDITRK